MKVSWGLIEDKRDKKVEPGVNKLGMPRAEEKKSLYPLPRQLLGC